jgi:hypothetical protein
MGCRWTPDDPEACGYCTGEACAKCGSIGPDSACEHDTVDRHPPGITASDKRLTVREPSLEGEIIDPPTTADFPLILAAELEDRYLDRPPRVKNVTPQERNVRKG